MTAVIYRFPDGVRLYWMNGKWLTLKEFYECMREQAEAVG